LSDTLLIVPGMTGCKLLLNGEDVGWPVELMIEARLAGATGGFGFKLDRLDPDKIAETLQMEYASDTSVWEPRLTTLRPGAVISPGPTLKLPYNQFNDAVLFDYDWRQDIRYLGKLLMEHLVRNKPAGDRWKLIGHSLGGLVLVAASKLFAKENGDDDSAFSRLVSHAVILASPLHGTMTAADALINGDNLSAPFGERFRKIVRTWPSIHQLLPAWFGSVKKKVNGIVVDEEYCLQDDAAWAGCGVDPSMLKRAREARQSFLRAPLSRMNNVKTRIILSKAWDTRNHALRDEQGRLVVGDGCEPGDNLVPQETTVRMSGAVEKERTLSFGDGKNTQVHALVGCDPAVATAVKDFFKQ
jgi:pimeloyl-ACP methyl ester carboxylesterase